MMGRKDSKKGFTLVEMMMALTIGGVVLSLVSSLLIQGMQLWQDYMGNWMICQQSRMAREVLLRGTEGRAGLRCATTNYIGKHTLQGKNVFTFTTPNATNSYFTVWVDDDGAMISSKIPHGYTYDHAKHSNKKKKATKSSATCEILDFEVEDRTVSCRYKLSVATHTTTFSAVSEINTPIINN